MKDNKSLDKLSDRLDKLEAENNLSVTEFQFGLTDEEFEKLSLMDKAVLKFNWFVKEIMPYYKEEVMSVHNLTSEEYDKRTLEADESIYLPQPNNKFEPTWYDQRVAHVLNLDFQSVDDLIKRGKIEKKIANGGFGCWRDEDPNAVF